MTWVKENWRWAILNIAATTIIGTLLWQAYKIDPANERFAYDRLLVASGKWAIRFLLLSLAMTPLNTIFGWRSAIKLRKPAGLWAFEFGAMHFLMNVASLQENWLRYPIPDYYAALGVIGLTILTLMALTSSKWAMKHMRRWWKRLHRLVYITGIVVLVHALLEAPSKRVFPHAQQIVAELTLYLIVLIVLLAVRIPVVRVGVSSLRHRLAMQRSLPASE